MHQEFRAITTRVARVLCASWQLRALRAALAADRRPARAEAARGALLVRERNEKRTALGRPPLAAPPVLDLIVAARRRFISMALPLDARWIPASWLSSRSVSNLMFAQVRAIASSEARRLDYGPFGFMERYDPKWAMWVGSGEHFSFGNQVEAARRNWETLE